MVYSSDGQLTSDEHDYAKAMKVLYCGAASRNLLNLQSLATCIGIATQLVDIRTAGSFFSAVEYAARPGAGGIVLDVESLADCAGVDEIEEVARLLMDRGAAVMLLATGVEESSTRFLRALTIDMIQAVHAAAESPSSVRFSVGADGLSGELASHSYPRKEGSALRLAIGSAAETDVVMSLDRNPSFVRVRLDGTNIFVWSTLRVFDVSRPLEAEKEFEDAADEYVPAIIFLRFAFGNRCWRNPRRGAGVVIDDPLLRRSYGFINFPELLRSARKHRYHVTLAFIPWNYWRSRRRDVRLFLDYSDCFSICAHGCDHTRNEFGSSDHASLLRKVFLAQERMERHRQRTGLESAPLMVCPQEQYSLEAMRALSDSGQFVGLVNTACIPRSSTTYQVCAADLLLPAQDAFYGFPVFKRHYWKDMSAFMMALFLGKHAILVEHHEFFRGGPSRVEEFAARLAETRADIKWTSIYETAIRTHVQRQITEGHREVRFFTNTFKLDNELAAATEYSFVRRISETAAVQRVVVNGESARFSVRNGYLRFEARADGPQTVSVQVVATAIEPTRTDSIGLKYQAAVAFRRGLSELRDNVLVRNRYAMKAASVLMRSMKQTGG